MACNIESFGYPSWWPGASTVKIKRVAGGDIASVSRADVEFLPQGISISGGVLTPWGNVIEVEKLS